MRKLLLILFVFSFVCGNSQTLYSWTSGVNPVWTASDNNNTHITWQSTIGSVSTNNANVGYTNNKNSTYTSDLLNLTCSSSSFVTLSVTIDVDLENRYDWLYLQYSTNNGISWANPVAQYAQTNLSGKNLSTFGLGTNNRNGFTGAMGVINRTYTIPETTNRIRWVFATDASTNSYGFFTTYFYYADITALAVNCIAILPVELLSFTAECKDMGGAVIRWTTASENSSSHFLVEKSYDMENWKVVDSVLSAGFSSTNTDYTSIEESERKGLAYYRLKQVDINGETKVYDPVSVFCSSNKDYISISPNPSNGNFTLEIYADKSLGVKETIIYDSKGSQVYNKNLDIKNGTTVLSFNLDLESGVYFMRVGEMIEKFVIIK